MRSAAIGALGFWSITAIAFFTVSAPVILTSFVLACVFTGVWLTHLALFGLRAARRDKVAWARSLGPTVERRHFLGVAARGMAFAAVASLLGRRAVARAQDEEPRYCVYVVINAVASRGFECPHAEGDVLCIPCPEEKNSCNENVTCVCKKIINREVKEFCVLQLSLLRTGDPPRPVTASCDDCPRDTEFTTVDARGREKKTKPVDISEFCRCSHFHRD
jgi:hypothetical protein